LESGEATILTEEDDGRTVQLAKGALLTIEVRGNRTTGYRWEAGVADGSVLRETGPPVFTAPSASHGAGGMYEFRYLAGAPGQTRLSLAYRRPWDSDAPALKTFEISVVVR
jgi:inhibitor of cysteine peptidase